MQRCLINCSVHGCPCGHQGDPERPCTCTSAQRTRYQARLSGPLLDRIDLTVQVPRLTVDELTRAPQGESTAQVRGRVLAARERMQQRQGTRNADLVGQNLQAAAALDAGPESFMRAAARQLSLTGRGYDRVLRVARTVADLAGSERIAEAHIAEALTFRSRELA